jgi:hypothetical protein
MSSVTGRPSAGARLVLEKVEETPAALLYRGFVHLPAADVPAEARVELPGGAVSVTLGEGGTPELVKTSAALVRAATKTPLASGGAAPRKIVRWRG